MRCLNLYERSAVSGFWKSHQLKSISKVIRTAGRDSAVIDVPLVEPLFPGSYLCNELVFLEHDVGGVGVGGSFCEASPDTIYESLSYFTEALFEPYILIDADQLNEVNRTMLFDTVCRKMEGVVSLLVLDRNLLSEIELLFDDLPLRVKAVDPDWSNAASILSLYRNSDHCIFIDNYRSMDAAVSGCSLSLISSSAFVQKQSTDALWYYLELYPNCQLLGAPSASAESGNSVVAIVGNSVHEVQRVFNGRDVTTYEDWLDEYREAPVHSNPVITPNPSVWYRPSKNILNLKLSLWRKTIKLSEDPKRFFIDSRIPLLKHLGKLIPTREAA